MFYKTHTFGPNQTIQSAIQLHNQHFLTLNELKLMMEFYAKLNGQTVPKVGDTVKIPVIRVHVDPV